MYKRIPSFYMLCILVPLILVVLFVTIFGAKLQFPFGETWSEFTFTSKPKIQIPNEEDITNLETTYTNLQSSLETFQILKAEANEIHIQVVNAIICSDTNWYFKQLDAKYKECEAIQLEIENHFSSYEEQYSRYLDLLDNIPDYAMALSQNKRQEFQEKIEPVYELVVTKKEQYLVDKTSVHSMYIEGQQLADSLFEEYMVWCPGLANAEGGNTPEEEICYILRVAENRIKSPKFPNTLHDVLFARGQYSTVASGAIYITPPERVYNIVERYLRGDIRVDMPDNVVFQSRFVQGTIWKYMPSGHYFCYG